MTAHYLRPEMTAPLLALGAASVAVLAAVVASRGRAAVRRRTGHRRRAVVRGPAGRPRSPRLQDLGQALPPDQAVTNRAARASVRSSELSTGGAEGRQHRARATGRLLARVPRLGQATAQRRDLEAAVPEVVDVLRATVAAGINPRRALQAAAEGAPPPLEALLGKAIQAANLGTGAGQALATAARSERLPELALAGEALDLAEMTGAPPGRVLAGVATAAADRVRARNARMAATAQARLSARVVAAMAPAFLGVLAVTSPSDAAFLIREPLGWATLGAATAFESLGICWATRIVRGPQP
jgi:Type II secretion system (T2SS), protein F